MRNLLSGLLLGSLVFVVLPAGRSRADDRAPGAAVPADELPARLSLADALGIFRARGFDLLIAEAAVRAAEGDLASARQVANPSVQLQGSRAFQYDPTAAGCAGCSSTGFLTGVSDNGALLDVAIGKRRLRVRVAEAALAAARLSRGDAERTLTALVKQQYVQSLMTKTALDFARETEAATAETFRLVDLRYREGALSESDSARAETARLEAEQAVSAAEQALLASKAGLAFLLGVRNGPPKDFALDATFVRTPVLTPLANVSPEDFYRLGSEHRPDLAAARAQVDSARAALDLAKRQRIPDIQTGLQYSQLGDGQNAIQPPVVSLGFSFGLPVFYRQKGEIEKAEAALRTLELTRDKTQAQVVSDVSTALAAWRAARERLDRMEGRLLDRARRARDLVDIQYRNGAASLLELLDAERTWIATNAEHRQILTDYWTAVFQLEAAVGKELFS